MRHCKGAEGERVFVNAVTPRLDASPVYGSDAATTLKLRARQGGRLLESPNSPGMPPLARDVDLPGPGHCGGEQCYALGDMRGNENLGLLVLHSLFLREHNYQADRLAQDHPEWDDERLFHEARSRVVAALQSITYHEVIPQLLGRTCPTGESILYQYNASTPQQVWHEFALALRALVLSGLPSEIQLRNPDEMDAGLLSIHSTHLTGAKLNRGGVVRVLHGLMDQPAQAFDPAVVDGVRSGFFMCETRKHNEGRDLMAELLQLSRDLDLPSYNDVRARLQLPRATRYGDITANKDLVRRLRAVYGDDTDMIEYLTGALAEPGIGGAEVGMTFSRVICSQLHMLRATDPFFFERPGLFEPEELEQLQDLSLTALVRRHLPELMATPLPAKAFQLQAASARSATMCLVSDWRNVGPCSVSCGSGRQEQVRDVLLRPLDAKRCPPLSRFLPCNTQPCPSGDTPTGTEGKEEEEAEEEGQQGAQPQQQEEQDQQDEPCLEDDQPQQASLPELAAQPEATHSEPEAPEAPEAPEQNTASSNTEEGELTQEGEQLLKDEQQDLYRRAKPDARLCVLGPADESNNDILACRDTAVGDSCEFTNLAGDTCTANCLSNGDWSVPVCTKQVQESSSTTAAPQNYEVTHERSDWSHNVYMWAGVGGGTLALLVGLLGTFEMRRRRRRRQRDDRELALEQHHHHASVHRDTMGPIYVPLQEQRRALHDHGPEPLYAPVVLDLNNSTQTETDTDPRTGPARGVQQRHAFLLKKPSQIYINTESST